MAFYEHIFLVRQDASNTQVEALTQQFKTVIEERGGKVTKTEYWKSSADLPDEEEPQGPLHAAEHRCALGGARRGGAPAIDQ